MKPLRENHRIIDNDSMEEKLKKGYIENSEKDKKICLLFENVILDVFLKNYY